MKSFLIALIFITSLLAANAAEVNCACSEDASIEYTENTHDHSEHDQNTTADHCDHSCGQCHFAAVISPSYFFVSSFSSVRSDFIEIHKQPLRISLSLYRPPIG